MNPNATMLSFAELVPLLIVESIERALALYVNQLGFSVRQEWGPVANRVDWVRLERDGVALMLQRACPEEDGPALGRGRGVALFFNCSDVHALHAEYVASGLAVDAPVRAFYGLDQIFLTDPDGYELCFQSPPVEAKPDVDRVC